MRGLFKSIAKTEWQFLILMSLVMIVLTGVPYLVGYLKAPVGYTYDGLHSLSPGDIPVYYSYIFQAKQGNFFAKDLFTAENQPVGTFNLCWVLVGLVARWLGWSVALTFQICRLILIPVFILIAYLFLAYFFTSAVSRKIGLIFILFSSGWGFFFASAMDAVNFNSSGGYYWPIDLWLTESVTFNALYQSSHFIASISLTLLIFLIMALAFDQKKISYALSAGVLALIYFNFHPYYFPVIFGTLGLYLLILIWQKGKILWSEILYLFLAFIISLPSVIYHYWLIASQPVIGPAHTRIITLRLGIG